MMDEMMGEDRNLVEEEKANRRRHFSDSDIDKFFLCGLSPHSALQNTKSDIGSTTQKQDQKMKDMWDAVPQEEKDKYGYERELLEFCESLIVDMDRKIKREVERIGPQDHTGLSEEHEKQCTALDAQIKELQQRAEQLGEDGEVDKAQEAFSQAETMKQKKNLIVEAAKASAKRLFVCEISGLVYSNLDGEQRLKDLKNGRMYRGWSAIRDKAKELRAKNPPKGIPGYKPSAAETKKAEEDAAREEQRQRSPDRRKERERSRSPRKDRTDPRDRDRDRRSYDRRDSDRSKDRGRDDRDRRDYRDRR